MKMIIVALVLCFLTMCALVIGNSMNFDPVVKMVVYDQERGTNLAFVDGKWMAIGPRPSRIERLEKRVRDLEGRK